MHRDQSSPVPPTALKETLISDSDEARTLDWKIGRVLLDEYRVTGILGKGMGIVFRVEPILFSGPPMALKTLFSEALASASYKRSLMNELRVWIELPEHPHFTGFRFFRTIEDRIGLFLEYVDGGSLEDWISAKKLLSLDAILDVAIQFAWALQSLHSLEIIHQDIKPKNVLLTQNRQVKLTDFGLAQARGFCHPQSNEAIDFVDYEVSFLGGTKGYCSPPQMVGQKLTLHTDIWSYGVSVLQMFTGSILWTNGASVRLFLGTRYTPGGYAPIAEMPQSVLDILMCCFDLNRTRRWNSMADVAQALINAYESELSVPYPRCREDSAGSVYFKEGLSSVPIAFSPDWNDPMIYFEKWRDIKLKSGSGEDVIPRKTGLPKTQALIDLQIYEELIHTSLFSTQERRMDEDVAEVFCNKGLVHKFVHDYPGAISCYDSAAAILDEQIQRLSKQYLLPDLANVYLLKSVCLNDINRFQDALDLFDRSICILDRVVEADSASTVEFTLIKTLIGKANLLKSMGRAEESLVMLDRAIDLLSRRGDSHDPEIRARLAIAYLNKATTLRERARYKEAIEFFNLSIDLFNWSLADGIPTTDTEPALALAYMNRAVTRGLLGQSEDAFSDVDRCIEIRERLIQNEGRRELEALHALALMNKATMIEWPSRSAESLDLLNRAISIFDRLVKREGRSELEDDLAMALVNKAANLAAQNLREEAVETCYESIRIYERLVYVAGRLDLKFPLSMVYMNLAISHFEQNLYWESLEMFDKSIAIREQNRDDLVGDLCWAQLGRVQVLDKLGYTGQAKDEIRVSIEVLRSEYSRTGRAGLKTVLDWIESSQAHLLE